MPDYPLNCPTCGTRLRVEEGEDNAVHTRTEADDIRFDAYVNLPQIRAALTSAEAALKRAQRYILTRTYDEGLAPAVAQAREIANAELKGDGSS